MLRAMAIESILAQIDAEIARLTQVRSLLVGSGKSANQATPQRRTQKPAAKSKRAHVLSPEARKRIADAQRRRWAAQKSKNKKEA